VHRCDDGHDQDGWAVPAPPMKTPCS
jgi:hypothetical protein